MGPSKGQPLRAGATQAATAGDNSCGTVFSLCVGLGPFVKTLPTSGQAGTPVIILGNNLTSAGKVRFNGTVANFTVLLWYQIQRSRPPF
jgi:hypothetical protein